MVMPGPLGRNTDHVPDMFASVYTGAPEVVYHDMWYDDLTFDDALTNHTNQMLGYDGSDDLDPFEIEQGDPFAVEKATYQRGIEVRTGAPMTGTMTPWGPSLSTNEVDSLIGLYPGIDSLSGANVYDFDGFYNDTDMALESASDSVDDLVDTVDAIAVNNGLLDNLGDLFNMAGDVVGALNPFSTETAYASPSWQVYDDNGDENGDGLFDWSPNLGPFKASISDWFGDVVDFTKDQLSNFGLATVAGLTGGSELTQGIQTQINENRRVELLLGDWDDKESLDEFIIDFTDGLTDAQPWISPEDAQLFINRLRDQGVSSFTLGQLDNALAMTEGTNVTAATGGPGNQIVVTGGDTTGGGMTGGGGTGGGITGGGGGGGGGMTGGGEGGGDGSIRDWGVDPITGWSLDPAWEGSKRTLDGVDYTMKGGQWVADKMISTDQDQMGGFEGGQADLSDVFMAEDTSPYSAQFENQFNQMPGSERPNARQFLPHLSADAEALFYLTQPPSAHLSTTSPTPYGADPDYRWGEAGLGFDQELATYYDKYAQGFLQDVSVLNSEDTRQSLRDLRDTMSQHEGRAFNTDNVQLQEDTSADLVWQREFLMDPTDSAAMSRLGNLVGAYSAPQGANRWATIRMQDVMTHSLDEWVRTGGSTESWMRAMVK